MTIADGDIVEYLYKHNFIDQDEERPFSTTIVYSCFNCGALASYPVVLDHRGHLIGIVRLMLDNKISFSRWLSVPCPRCGKYADPTVGIPLTSI